MITKLLNRYKIEYGNPEIYVKSPGRANIIGEHTDYNKGLVLPFAIEQCIHFYIGTNQKGLLRLFAFDLDEKKEFDVTQIRFHNSGWERYFINALVAIQFDTSKGIDVVFGGNLPQGGGVSSSSAIACGFLSGINSLFHLNKSIDELISLASQSENGIGLNGGIMDQTAIMKGKEDKSLKIDFLDNSIEEISMPPQNYSFYLFNSGQSHNLVDTEYNKRRSTCENALITIQKQDEKVQSLRDVTIESLNEFKLDRKSYQRCAHVIQENNRVEKVVQLINLKDFDLLGNVLLDSHQSLSKNYEVSTPEIDFLVHLSQSIPNMLGSRIMGGGFGGCTINFVKGKLNQQEIEHLKSRYETKTGLNLSIIEIKASKGVEILLLTQ